MKIVHNWLKEYIGDNIPQAEKIEELLTFHAFEIEGRETVGECEVTDVDILPNRSSDCLCHRGIAREVATLTGEPLANDPFASPVTLAPLTDKLAVTIEDDKGCRRFGAALLTGVTVGESPGWLKERLQAIGQRPINSVVDITNYVMFSLGQPIHAYDADKFPQTDGVYQFGVRYAKDGEKVSVLGGDEYELDPSIQLITEGATDTGVSIAGIKGGNAAEVDSKTTSIIFEAANFDPTITRKAAQKIKLQTDASKRFENEIVPEVIPYALMEAVRLLTLPECGQGILEGYLDEILTVREQKTVAVTLEKINSLLGLSLSSIEVEDILNRLGFESNAVEGGWNVKAPFERTDINIEEDVVEEVGRVYGYAQIASVVPETVPLPEYNARHYYSEKIRALLMSYGFSEVITSSFRKKDDVCLHNALASDKGCLRSNLTKNIHEVLDRNAGFSDLLGTPDTRVFEIGTVFKKGDTSIEEHVSLCFAVRTKVGGFSKKDEELLTMVIGELTNDMGTNLSFAKDEGVAELNLTEVISKLPAPIVYDEVRKESEDVQYRVFSVYPHMSRDVALWVEEGVQAADVEAILNAYAGELRVRTSLFDEFSKDGRTSYAFRLVFQSNEKTLTDEEINMVMEHIYAAAKEKSWEVR
ncbi:MAG: phenylalanyl-tRNA synthetase beta chain [Candidatus Azotimanducaceae bacterium]|jgi:phenylalanyl-tRNA synthetase beta chain